jgi:o-succinylbenzoate synthase
MTEKNTYFIKLFDTTQPEMYGTGECSTLKKLSIDDMPQAEYEAELVRTAEKVNEIQTLSDVRKLVPDAFPSIQFGLETAWLDLQNNGKHVVFQTDFVNGAFKIPINGLIWMGKPDFMKKQIDEKLTQGFKTLKMKIGAIDFEEECKLLAYIRQLFPKDTVTLRVDANGAFGHREAMSKLEKLATFDIHSIEQPIKQGQPEAMADICRNSPVPVALDEELIGIADKTERRELLEFIKPQYIILKPSLLGGFEHTSEWIQMAEESGIDWWITSALEANPGLNAIAQFTASFQNLLPQGLGTGQLYHNNIDSPLTVENGFLWYDSQKFWSKTD